MFNKRRVPRDGQILVSPALRGSNVTAALKQRRASMSVGKVPDLDVDYVCGTGCAAVVLSEATVIAGPGKPSLKAKLTALKGYSRPAVLMMNTPMVAGQYMAFQTWVLTAFRLPVLPVTTADEAAQYLQELARQTVKPVELQRPPTENMVGTGKPVQMVVVSVVTSRHVVQGQPSFLVLCVCFESPTISTFLPSNHPFCHTLGHGDAADGAGAPGGRRKKGQGLAEAVYNATVNRSCFRGRPCSGAKPGQRHKGLPSLSNRLWP
eukprot:m.39183 g.39183  ORF g.39183 m.39183 type:complete len:264 (+) comp11246_c1_seq1:173-964(+)